MEGNVVRAFFREDDVGHLDDELHNPARVIHGYLSARGKDHLLGSIEEKVEGESVLSGNIGDRGVDIPRRQGGRDLPDGKLRESPDDPFLLVVLRDDPIRNQEGDKYRLRQGEELCRCRGRRGSG